MTMTTYEDSKHLKRLLSYREKAIRTGTWRVKTGPDLYRDNQPGDYLPEAGVGYGLPG